MLDISLQKKLNAPNGELLLDIQCQIEQGQFITLYGKSGEGKTSTLRMLAGLMTPDFGKIKVQNNTWLDSAKGINLPPQVRNVGLVFQDFALFPNMTVRENLTFALRKNQQKQIIHELIEIIELGQLQHQKPTTLSGGQKQRVALARALVQQPQLLMLDEPLSALDPDMRSKLQNYLLQVHQTYNLTTILVSHDIAEIIKMSDQIFVLENGKITQKGDPMEILGQQKIINNFKFKGKVFNIEKKEGEIIITLSSGENNFIFALSSEELKTIQLGDQIEIDSTVLHSKFRKIN